MAPRKPSRLLEDPPSASPSQDHEEEEDLENSLIEEYEESEEEEDDEPTQKTLQISKLSETSQNQAAGKSSEEEEEGSETDNDNTKNSPTASSFIVKPAVNKNNHSMEPRNPTTKRALIDSDERKDSSKKTKVVKDHFQEDGVGSAKKAGSASGRVWNPDDVIAILEGMISYQKQKGADPHADMAAFFEFVKGSFGFEVTKSQLYEKVRSLKKKFVANIGKGESFIPTKPHDIECFELSKKIWGGKNVAGGVGNSGSNANDTVVANGVDHTEHVKIVNGDWVTKKSAKGNSSEGKRKEKKGEKNKKESEKKNKKKNKKKKMDDGLNIEEKEAEPVTDEDVIKEKEDFVKNDEKAVGKEVVPVTDDVMKDVTDDVMKDVTDEDVMKDVTEEVAKDDEKISIDDGNVVKETSQNIPVMYPNLIASLSFDMPESRRKFMMEGISLLDSDKARELDDSWKELQIKEAECYCKKLELMAEQSRLVIDALKNR